MAPYICEYLHISLLEKRKVLMPTPRSEMDLLLINKCKTPPTLKE